MLLDMFFRSSGAPTRSVRVALVFACRPYRELAAKSKIAQRIPLGREGVDTDCGNVAVFLASRMSAYVTGVVVPVDGGTWASSGWVHNRAGKWTLVEELPLRS